MTDLYIANRDHLDSINTGRRLAAKVPDLRSLLRARRLRGGCFNCLVSGVVLAIVANALRAWSANGLSPEDRAALLHVAIDGAIDLVDAESRTEIRDRAIN